MRASQLAHHEHCNHGRRQHKGGSSQNTVGGQLRQTERQHGQRHGGKEHRQHVEMRFVRFEVLHVEEAERGQHRHRHDGHDENAVPTERRHQRAAHHRGECGAERDHAAADGQVRAQLVLRRDHEDGVHHKRDEDARAHRLHEARDQQQLEAGSDEPHRGADDAQAGRAEEQRAHMEAPIEKRHARDHDGGHDHVAGDQPLSRHGVDAVLRHDGHERHVDEVLVEPRNERAAVQDGQQQHKRFPLHKGIVLSSSVVLIGPIEPTSAEGAFRGNETRRARWSAPWHLRF